MEPVGVEAVVEGLTSFLGDMKKMDQGIAGLTPTTNLLGRAFSGLESIVSNLVGGAFRILEYTIGNLLSSAIQGVIGWLKDLASATIDAGSEFQALEIRLRNLNFNSATDSGLEYSDAMAEATEKTKEQLDWIQKLAIKTPFDAQDVANVFTLARGYGFAADQSKKLTEDVSNFTAGMGLGNQELQRIIINFGQMTAQGKVSGRELTDLARGALFPVADVMKIMQEQTGLTGKAFKNFSQTGEGVTAFIAAFSTLVQGRFANSAENAARTFKGASDNVQDFVKSLIGLNVVKPILDIVGGKIADLVNQLTSSSNWENFSAVARSISKSLIDILNGIMGLGPSATGVVDFLFHSFVVLANWLDSHKGNIVEFFQSIRDAIMEKVVPFITDVLIPAFNKISGWVLDNKETIFGFFSSLGDIISTVFGAITNQPGKPAGGGLDGFLKGVKDFMQYVIDNKDSIAKWVEILWSVVVVFSVLQGIFSIVVGVITKVVTVFLAIQGITWLLGGAISALVATIGAFLVAAAPIVAVIGLIVFSIGLAVVAFKLWKTEAIAAFSTFKAGFQALYDIVIATVGKVTAAFLKGDWPGVGRAIIQGIIGGIGVMVSTLVSAAVNAAMAAYNAVKRTLGIRSPSTLFMEIGEMSVKGLAAGVEQFSGLAASAMSQVAGQMAMSAMAVPGTQNTYQNTNNFNQTINTTANSEPIISDFNMMQSIIGA